MWAALLSAGPWAAFLGLAAWIAWAFYSGRVISVGEYRRAMEQHDREIAAERRISQAHEKRAEVESARADTANTALVKLVAELPEALRYVNPGSA